MIIVGTGPVGLGAALELARFDVRSVVLEKGRSATRQHGVMIGFSLGRNVIASLLHEKQQPRKTV